MNGTQIKICGVKSPDIARAAAQAGARWVGLVFVSGSPRHLSLDHARTIVAALPPEVEPVGLFVDDPVERVRQVAREVGLHTVQLHGHETPEYVASLTPLAVFKAVSFEAGAAEHLLDPWRQPAPNLQALLLDAPPQPSGAVSGGNGHAFDWQALADLQQTGGLRDLPPWLLAGGLSPENVTGAIQLLHPFGVDVSSGVESARGVKDPALIRAFCQAVQAADRAQAVAPG